MFLNWKMYHALDFDGWLNFNMGKVKVNVDTGLNV